MIESLIALSAILIATPALAADETELRVSAHIPLSPFVYVTYELKFVGRNAAVALTRFHADEYGSDSEVELLSVDAYQAALEAAAPCFEGSSDATEPSDVTIPWLDVRTTNDGAEERTVIRRDSDEATHDACLAALREVAASNLRVDEYQMPYWDEGEFGTLRATANLPARLYVDGHPTGLVTPVNGLRLEPGVRHIRWVAIVTDQEVVQSVTIVAGMTTQVTGTFEEAPEAE